MAGKDKEMLKAITGSVSLFEEFRCSHPLDDEIINILNGLLISMGDDNSDYAIYRYSDQTDLL